MQRALGLALFAAAAPVASVANAAANPLGTVLKLMDELAAKVTADGEAAAKAYHEYFEWCDDTSKNLQFSVETATKEKAKLDAQIGELISEIEAGSSEIETLGASLAKAEEELKNATVIREKEAAEFAASEGEMMDAVDTLGRAVAVLEREMAKSPTALAQVDSKNMAGALQALSAVLEAAAFPGSDQKKLLALVQSKQGDDEDDLQPGAPAAAVYESKSGGIVDVLEDMKEKAEGELSDLRKAEMNSKHNYEMVKQSLEDQMAADTKNMEDEKANKAAAEEAKATAEGDLETTTKELVAATKDLETTRSTCIQVAADHEASMTSRAEELKVIAEAKKILQESTGGAAEQSYAFVQVASGTAARGTDILRMVKHLARQHHSAALAQLASRIEAVARYGASSGADPFGKIKGLIKDMIVKLEKEMADEATEKAYCDEQMSKTEAKKSELDEDVAKLTAKIDQAAAKSAELKEQIQELESELAALAKEQAELDGIRSEQHSDYSKAKADLEQGLSGVRQALKVLRDYYAADDAAALVQDEANFGSFMQQPAPPQKHDKASGAGTSIIGILEVCESDFATSLAKEETEEADSQAEYDKITQENKVAKASMDQDVKYKTAEATSLDKTVGELSSDRETLSTELAAVNEYYAKIKDRCVAKPESYEERKARRDAEIKGLKEALTVLEQETAFVQRKRTGLRGAALQAR